MTTSSARPGSWFTTQSLAVAIQSFTQTTYILVRQTARIRMACIQLNRPEHIQGTDRDFLMQQALRTLDLDGPLTIRVSTLDRE